MKWTKRQIKNRNRIEAWIAGEPFRENARAKPAVPDLTVEDVLETFVPDDVQGTCAFFTPLDMGRELWYRVGAKIDIDEFNGKSIIDLGAGIGSLGYALNALTDDTIFDTRSCVELSLFNFQTGSKILPSWNWRQENVYDFMYSAQRADVVCSNPPFGSQWVTHSGTTTSKFRLTKSEHLFLETALSIVRGGGKLTRTIAGRI